ncbi:transcription factor bHLH162 [Canna indica]|uniref:Transcription factor bHLH162 n=1 Tax=Canna indica TaxID=4628 RepID=A0AAQ3JX53_9LILI|nr:transcription factor bHLH162 [Canna indica]
MYPLYLSGVQRQHSHFGEVFLSSNSVFCPSVVIFTIPSSPILCVCEKEMKSSSVVCETGKIGRKIVEKNRRMQMKTLCMKLSSLIPKEHNTSPKDMLTQQDHLEQATSYIKKLQKKIETMKQRRVPRMNIKESGKDIGGGLTMGFQLPVVEVRHDDSNMEVVLISGLEKRFMFHEVISIIEEEGAEVINASFSVVGEKIFHIIHSQAISSRLGLEASRVTERLKKLL